MKKHLGRNDILKYAEEMGNKQAGADLLLLLGPDAYDGSAEEYEELMKELTEKPKPERRRLFPAESEKVMKHVKRFFKALFNCVMLMLGLDCKARRDAVEGGVLDLSGQGRGKHGN